MYIFNIQNRHSFEKKKNEAEDNDHICMLYTRIISGAEAYATQYNTQLDIYVEKEYIVSGNEKNAF